MKSIIFTLAILAMSLSGTACQNRTDPPNQTPPEPPPGIEAPAPEPQSKQEPATEQPAPLRLVGYLPATSVVEEGTEFDQNISLLTDAILNVAAYWDEAGQIVPTEAFSPAMTRLGAIDQKATNLWCTVNPKGSLVRASTAGETIRTAEQRRALADQMAAFCLEHGFSGIDIDWEFPTETEWQDFSSLIVQIKEVFIPQNLKLSLALYPGKDQLTQEAIAAVDFINIMAYDLFDQQGYHSTYEAAEQAIKTFCDRGFQPKQLCLGIPFYGRPTDQSAQWPTYRAAEGLTTPSDNLDGDVYYNGIDLVQAKTALAKEAQLSGVMLYHLYCDLPASNPRSLIASIAPGR